MCTCILVESATISSLSCEYHYVHVTRPYVSPKDNLLFQIHSVTLVTHSRSETLYLDTGVCHVAAINLLPVLGDVRRGDE